MSKSKYIAEELSLPLITETDMKFATCLLLFAILSTGNAFDVKKIESKLKRIFKNDRIPKGMTDWIAVLDDSINILKCLPTIKEGRCFKSRSCQLPKLKFGSTKLPFILKICEHPWQIIIDFLPLDLPWYAKVQMKPFIITIVSNEHSGVFTIKSHTNIKAKVRYINFGVAKASLKIDGIIRYDCTKPRGSENWLTRARYNLEAPNKEYTSRFFKLRIRIEVKVKKFNWFRFNYECKRCEDLVNKSGTFGKGPRSCSKDMTRYHRYVENNLNKRKCGKHLRLKCNKH